MVLVVQEQVLRLVGNSFYIAPVTLVVALVSEKGGSVLELAKAMAALSIFLTNSSLGRRSWWLRCQ